MGLIYHVLSDFCIFKHRYGNKVFYSHDIFVKSQAIHTTQKDGIYFRDPPEYPMGGRWWVGLALFTLK